MNAIEELESQLERQNFTLVADPDRASETQLAEAEAFLGYQLPEDFRWFVQTHGKGFFLEPVGRSIALGDGTVRALDRIGGSFFLPKKDGGTYCPPNFPPGLVPCADTIMGDVYFLRLDPPHDGNVWYWGFYEGKDKWDGMVKVADSFTDLVASAGPPPPE